MSSTHPDAPLIVLAGPTASGKTALSLALAARFDGEIVSCDSVAVYRHMEIGTAKPTPAERARIPHHMIDVVSPGEPYTAGDYSRAARCVLAEIITRNKLPIVAGGTGLYIRALIEGLTPAPTRDEQLRNRLRALAAKHGEAHLHRLLTRIDPAAARRIHPNDIPKIIRALEVSLTANASRALRNQTAQWAEGRDPLTGYRILYLGLAPPRAQLYARIDQRAAAMFRTGLVAETAALMAKYGPDCRAFGALGYAQAAAVLRNQPGGELSATSNRSSGEASSRISAENLLGKPGKNSVEKPEEESIEKSEKEPVERSEKESVEKSEKEPDKKLTIAEAIAAAQQAHRNYAKRQQTWFRKIENIHWLPGFGDHPAITAQAETLVQQHLADLVP